MDKYEYNVKLEQIKKLIRKKDYSTAARIADTIEWYRVKNNQTIVLIADVYEASGRYEQAKENLKIAYDRTGLGRQIAFKLVKVCIKCGNLEEAEEFYDDFVSAAPKDISKYLLQYELAKAKGAPLDEQIRILEEYLEEDMDDKWAFELAKLYHKSGQRDKCIDQCDTLLLWFSDGKYVDKAMELKMIYTPLTKSQQQRYEALWRRKSGESNIKIDEFKVKEVDVANKYNTQNIQAALKESMDEIFAREEAKKNQDNDIFKPFMKQHETVRTNSMEIYDETEMAASTDDYLKHMSESVQSTQQEDLGNTKVFRTSRFLNNLGDTKVFHIGNLEERNTEAVSKEQNEQAYIIEEKTIIKNQVEKVVEEETTETEETVEEAEIAETEETVEEAETTETEETVVEAETVEAEEKVVEEEIINKRDEFIEPQNNVVERVIIQYVDAKEEEIEEQIEGQMSFEDFLGEDGSYHMPDTDKTEDKQEINQVEEESDIEEKVEPEEESDVEEVQAEEESDVEEVQADTETDLSGALTEEEWKTLYGQETTEGEPEVEEVKEEIDPFETITDLKITKDMIKESRKKKQEEERFLTNKEIKEIIKDFIGKYSGVQGLDKQMLKSLQNVIIDDNCNIFIMGDVKSGKTSIGIDIIKVINKIKRNNNRKIAKISADKLNGKDVKVYFNRLEGSDLYIENVSLLDEETLENLFIAIDEDLDNRIVVIEDEKNNAEKLLKRNTKISSYFVNTILVKQNKIRDWAVVAEEYAISRGYRIDEMGILALHAKIDELYGELLVIQKNHVQAIVDNAIRRAEKGGLFKKLFAGKRSKVLSEEHF